MSNRLRIAWGPLLLVVMVLAGCGPTGVDSEYGRSLGKSVNGTGTLAALLRERGHDVRTVSRLNDRLDDRADVLIRFAPYPGPPERAEADWYEAWLSQGKDRRLVFVLRDYDAEHDYWTAALNALGEDTPSDVRDRIQTRSQETAAAPTLPNAPSEVGDPDRWFTMKPTDDSPAACTTLEGPWAQGIDASKAGLIARKTPAPTVENVLLSGNGRVLAMEWSLISDNSRVLAVANGSFLLNATLLNEARRPLAERLADWVGNSPRRVVFVEGANLAGAKMAGGFHLTRSMTWVVAHLAVFGLLAALALATRLGPPRPDEPTGAERPVAHAEALGDLLAKSRDLAMARTQLETYRRWRQPASTHPPRS